MIQTTKTLDWDKYLKTAAQVVSEGIVMLKNEHQALPLKPHEEIALFGRIQFHYYKSGTGSGGMVNVSKVTNIVDGLQESGIKLNQELLDVYHKWDNENPFDLGDGWGKEPWSQKEMPLEDSLAARAAKRCQTAIAVIGRTAGEEQDNSLTEGSFLLSSDEKQMLTTIRRHFSKMIVLLNVGNIIDMNELLEIAPDAILYVWQGGMTGGTGTADVLTGKISPCGKLTDTIAKHVEDYPSAPYFGDPVRNFYSEDIYVGYRYFETFAPDKVLYPFGFGLSYTTFQIKTNDIMELSDKWDFIITVTNTGSCSGKEVVQIYCEAPQGKLGKPVRVLCGYEKTNTLSPGESQTVTISVSKTQTASYDDSGISGHAHCFILEEGDYHFYVGTDVRHAVKTYTCTQNGTLVISSHQQALAPVEAFERIKPVLSTDGYEPQMEPVPLSEVDETKRRLENLPKEIPFTGDRGIRLCDVRKGTHTMEEFIAQMTDYDLACVIRGEGMNSPRVTAGTASAFGGVSQELEALGVPCGCCDDGPSGMRLDCGTKAFSLPNGTMMACTFNRTLLTELFALTGLEMIANKVDCLLGPGMNIHRHPLNGRNFEYFSEDPYLTGTIASAQLHGLHQSGVTGTIKHFCGNNQETNRHDTNGVISERALREIYLKGFEIAVKEGHADSVMTTYGPINGVWTAGSFDLTTQILRNDWGFTGFTMTDWWANINRRGQAVDKSDFAAMAIAQNDVYMVCAIGAENDDNILASLENGTLQRSELQRNAANICRFLMNTQAMARLEGTETKIDIINRPADESDVDESSVKFYELDGNLTINLEDICTDKGTNHSFGLDIKTMGKYRMTLTASSTQSEVAQIPVTLFSLGTAYGTFTWNGTNGLPVSFETDIPLFSKYTNLRLFFAQGGLKMHSITFELISTEL
ncbi:glycoside hydrolase family 3 C-terminal domain-containing protein [Jutongia huaianensis]|uniref:Glycoside hydrolase family 3 C-terminal domain-containing protein n=1 Tax=Jutongia huaianensis TaxID=2763668 RepID=A0ABR7N2H6_9FIRM|nr:glycoside hydrolase family 3 C-terminal domain-containing protein [Jutongia huaianensis]MBC8562832.1 glycoside hydrolase family 3 C-terminal domain-containing protein [Jutongia huaianensis]